ncbi:Sec-independent protein translocase protein TatA [Phycisphaerales bacterium]|nr:Sec-independent protein translocase protein TatA [Phycisphaerales bacterium]
MFGLSTWELVIILVIALLLFGRRLPEVGKSLGKGIIEFKKGLKGVDEEIEKESSRPGEKRMDVPEDRGYRAPLAEGGGDRRVSRSDVVEEKPEQVEKH